MSDDTSVVIRTLIDTMQSLQLATLSAEGQPEISYCPFIAHDQGFVILISDLAAHTRNLRHHAQCSAMLIEDEQQATNPFARTRLMLQCRAQWVTRESAEQPALMEQFRARHGATVDVLATLPDFHLCLLEAIQGRFVTGFAKAYTFQGFAIDQCHHIGRP